jgi:hypothetical protein
MNSVPEHPAIPGPLPLPESFNLGIINPVKNVNDADSPKAVCRDHPARKIRETRRLFPCSLTLDVIFHDAF